MTAANIELHPVPAFDDNYLWLLQQQGSKLAYIVDPGDAAPVLATLRQRNLELGGIIVTHHHWDHTGGIDTLLEHFPVPVYGPDSDKTPQISHPLREGDSIALFGGVNFEILEVPGHTLDHIAYFAKPPGQPPILLCGDTLFAGGCGRLFEGTPGQMHQSLGKLAQLPGDTAVYCTHEYTLANLRFAQAVEPDNQCLTQRVNTETHKRERQQPTLPSTISLEMETNPFLRCHLDTVKQAAESHSAKALNTPEAVLASIRAWKDIF